MARELTLISVLLSLAGGEGYGAMLCFVIEACKSLLFRMLGQGLLSCEPLSITAAVT